MGARDLFGRIGPGPRAKPRRDLPAVAAGAGGGGRVSKVGRGGTRIWLEGLWLLRSGFEAFGEATVLLDKERHRVVLVLDPKLADTLSSGSSTKAIKKKISGKVKRGKNVPVIDIERKDLREILGGAEQVIVQSHRGHLVITPSQAEVLREERLAAPQDNREVSLYSGAGFLSLAAEQAGYRPVLAIEKWEQAADAFFAAHRGQVPVLELGVEQVALGEQAAPGRFGLPRNPWLMTAGVPCETYSRLGGKGTSVWGRSKGATEAHQLDPHQLADQAFWTLLMVILINPVNVVIENVENFTKYAGGFVRALQVLGYHVHVGLADPSEHGYAAGRKRAVIVATTHPGFSFPEKRSRKLSGQRLVDLLFAPGDPRLSGLSERHGGWFSTKAKKGLGKSLASWIGKRKYPATTFEYSDARVPAVTKSMHKGSPTGPYLRHPERRDLYRMLTLEEIERIHGVPAAVANRIRGASEGKYPLVSQLYGQGVHVPIFAEILGRLPGPAITTRQRQNPAPVVPVYYGAGPLFSTIPWGGSL